VSPLRFADVESLLVTHLEARLAVRATTRLPAKFETALPIIRVTRVGGPDDGLNDFARITVETFAATRPASWDLAEDARQAMLAASHTVVSGRLIDTVSTDGAPVWVDYANDSVQRFLASYTVVSRIRAV
jgi:hypothetical protein